MLMCFIPPLPDFKREIERLGPPKALAVAYFLPVVGQEYPTSLSKNSTYPP